MSNPILLLIVLIIKIYKFLVSPLLGNNCRFFPTCSEYFIEALKVHGVKKGTYLGIKRIFSCHPIKFLGGDSGLDFVPNKKKEKNG
tara:strand:+ start:515 stop:772 length:258 start_codon:yes stop_codon:yes gene_type:complete